MTATVDAATSSATPVSYFLFPVSYFLFPISNGVAKGRAKRETQTMTNSRSLTLRLWLFKQTQRLWEGLSLLFEKDFGPNSEPQSSYV